MRTRGWILLAAIAGVAAMCGPRPACADAICGNGVVEPASEECDDGGTCIGDANAGTHCTAESDCVGNGVCIGGPKAETACADSSACPGGMCRHCVPQGGDGCAANCTNETQITVSVLPGHVTGTSLDPGTSGATIWNEVLGPLVLAFQPATSETVAIGKDRGDGIVPAVVIANSVHFPKIDVQGLACACVRSVATKTCGGVLFQADDTPATDCTPGYTNGDSMCAGGPPCTFVYGEGTPGSGGNAGSGVISCVAGLPGVNLLFTQDSAVAGGTDPPQCDYSGLEFIPGLGAPVCGQAPQITTGGAGPAGSAVLLNTVTIGHTLGACSAQAPTYCTDADPFSERGVPATVSTVTGTAAAAMFNINNNPGDTLCNCPPGLSSCDISQCVVTQSNPAGALTVTGQPLASCASLQASPPNVTGLGLAGAFASLSNETVGDIVVTSLLLADGVTTPLPTNTPAGTITPTPTIACAGDCNGDHVVTVDELLVGIGIALGNGTVAQCPSLDINRDGQITVDELVAAVNNALNGCVASS